MGGSKHELHCSKMTRRIVPEARLGRASAAESARCCLSTALAGAELRQRRQGSSLCRVAVGVVQIQTARLGGTHVGVTLPLSRRKHTQGLGAVTTQLPSPSLAAFRRGLECSTFAAPVQPKYNSRSPYLDTASKTDQRVVLHLILMNGHHVFALFPRIL